MMHDNKYRSETNFSTALVANEGERRVTINGKVAIVDPSAPANVTFPIFGSTLYKLAVQGNVIAEDFTAMLRGDWNDNVFDPAYKRMTWQEKEKYYKEKRHLFGVPSAEDLKRDGLKVNEILSGFVLNIEENSLDIVDLYKMIKQLQEENKNLRERLNKMENTK